MSSGYLITSGNEAGLSIADYIAFFAAEPDVRVILCYIEAVADLAEIQGRVPPARSSAGKPVIVHKLGQSEAGKEAALAHTGSLAGSAEAFDAVTGELGVIRVDNHSTTRSSSSNSCSLRRRPKGRRLGAITLSGAYRGLLFDAAEQNHLDFPPLAPETTARLRRAALGRLAGRRIRSMAAMACCRAARPISPASRRSTATPTSICCCCRRSCRACRARDRTESYLRARRGLCRARAQKPIAFVSVLSHGHSDYSRALRAELPHLSFLNESGKAMRAIDLAIRREELAARADSMRRPRRSTAASLAASRALARDGQDRWRSARSQSKELLRPLRHPRRRARCWRHRRRQAARAWRREIGFPVVLKIASAAVPHKSDVGGVLLDLRRCGGA